jgi:hypothetical protein
MDRKLWDFIKDNELYFVSIIMGIIFISAMAMVAWMFRTSIAPPPYQEMSGEALENVFATGYLRFREDNGEPYLKVEVHNGGQWWIRKINFKFNGKSRALVDPEIFRPLSFGAMRLILDKAPEGAKAGQEYDIKITRAFGYPPAAQTLDGRRHVADNDHKGAASGNKGAPN